MRSRDLLALMLSLSTATTVADDTPAFKITMKRDNDRVQVKVDKNVTVFSVRSPFEISQAVIERTDEKPY